MSFWSIAFDIAIAAIFLICITASMKKGFIKSSASILSIVLTIVMMFAFSDGINEYLKRSELGERIGERVSETIAKNDNDSENEKYISSLPGFLRPAAEEIDKTTQEIKNKTCEGVTSAIINLLAVLLLYAAVRILLFFAFKILNVLFKLPILKSVNKVAGMAIGAVNALFIVYILCACLIFFGTGDMSQIMQNTFITHYFYDNNILLEMFM